MSHVADVDLTILDLDALERACAELGLELVRGQHTYKWYGTWVNDYSDPERAAAVRGFNPQDFGKCEHAIRRAGHKEGDYEIGLVARPDGTPGYSVLYDNFGSGRYFATKLAGAGLPELKDEYGAQVATRYWTQKGYHVKRQRNAQNETQIVAYQR